VDINLNMTFLEGPATEMVPLLMKKLTEEVQN
ncbi:MAG: hypothetical protein ACI9K1_000595, partial [Arcticibacterium sp.]